MKGLKPLPRYAREGALATLKRDVLLLLLELKSKKQVFSFELVNERLSESSNMLNIRVVLPTDAHQEILYSVAFHRREALEKVSVINKKSRGVFVLINRMSATLSTIRGIFEKTLQGFNRGFGLEQEVLVVVSRYIEDHPDGFLRSISKTAADLDQKVKDFEIGVWHENHLKKVFVDITGAKNIRRKKQLIKSHGDKNTIIVRADLEMLKQRPLVFIQMLENKILHHLKKPES